MKVWTLQLPSSTLSVTSHDGVNFAIATHYQHYLWLPMKVWTLYSPTAINITCDFTWRCELCVHHPLLTLSVTSHESVNFVSSPLATLSVTSHEDVNFVSATHYQHYLWLCMKVWTSYSPPTLNTICDFAWRCEFVFTTHYQHYLWLHMMVWILPSPPTINTFCDFAWWCELCNHHPLSTLSVTSHESVNFAITTHY